MARRPMDLEEYELAEVMFYTDDGRPFRLHHMPFFKPVYNTAANRILLKTSRQSTKTTYIRNRLVRRSTGRPGNSSLYIAPTGNQIADFSKNKLDNVFVYNEKLKAKFVDTSCDWNVMSKSFTNRSTITLRSTGGHRGAEAVRGKTANDIYKDEYQSLLEEHLPVIDACATTFDGKDGRPKASFVDTGTPLSLQNPIEKSWNLSQGLEWLIRCPKCHRWNEPLGMKHIDPKRPFLYCQHCGHDMNTDPLTGKFRVPHGEWVATNPKGPYPGYRIVRLMMPWCQWRSENADGVLDQLENWPERRFMNETMALPFEGGQAPITEAQIKACCQPYRLPETEYEMAQVAAEHGQYMKFAGLDWSMNSDESTPSYTVFAVYALIGQKMKLIFAHKFVGLGSNDPDFVLGQIGKWMNVFDINVLGCDYGVGYKENIRLMNTFPGRVMTFHYKGGAVGKVQTTYDPVARKYMLPRTPALNNLFLEIEKGNIILPEYDDARRFTMDWLRIYSEISDATRTEVFRRSGTDDFAHVSAYVLAAKKLYTGHDQAHTEMYGDLDDYYYGALQKLAAASHYHFDRCPAKERYYVIAMACLWVVLQKVSTPALRSLQWPVRAP